MDLQPVAVVLQLVRPARPRWGLLGDDRAAGMKAAGALIGLPRELRHNLGGIYCENGNGATQQTLYSGPGSPGVPPDTRLLGLGHHRRLALSFGPARDQDAAVPLPD